MCEASLESSLNEEYNHGEFEPFDVPSGTEKSSSRWCTVRHPIESSFVYISLFSCQITCLSSIILQNQVWRKCYEFYMNMDIKCSK